MPFTKLRCAALTAAIIVGAIAHADDPFESTEIEMLGSSGGSWQTRLAGYQALLDPVEATPQESETVTPQIGTDNSSTEESVAQDKGEEDDALERLAKLEAQLEAMTDDWQDFQDDLAKEAKEKKKKPNMKIGGRVHADYWHFADSDPGINVIESGNPNIDPQDRFLFRRLRLEMSGTVPQNMLWRMQIDFNNPGRPEIKDAYLGWSGLPNNQVLLFGNQKRPMGLDHLNSSRFNVFAERPLAVETFNEDARRFGLTMYGHNDPKSVGWAYGVYNLENINTDGRFIGDSLQLGGWGRLWSSPWYDETSGGRGYWHMAISGGVANPDGDGQFDSDDNNNEGRFRTRPLARSDERWLNTGRIPGADWYQTIGLESILNVGALQITGEYLFTTMQRDSFAPAPLPTLGPYDANIDEDLFFHGGYIYASYFLTGEHMPYNRANGVLSRVKPFENFFLVDRCNGCRGRGWGALQVALRYDHLDLTDGGVNGGVGNMVTAGLNWHWTAYSKLQTNAIWGTIDQSGNAGPNFNGGDFAILGMRFMIDF